MSKEERAELEARLAADDAAEDDDTSDYEVGFPTGHYIRGRWARVREAARAQGFRLEEEPPDMPAQDDKPAKPRAVKDDDGPGEEGRRFAGRRIS